jgi:hypothetical protein
MAQEHPPATCPVTKESDAFIPPQGYPRQPHVGSIFVGTPKLWTLVWLHDWQGRKLVWWNPRGDRETTSAPELTVSLRRLDAPAPPMTTERAHWAIAPHSPPFITTGVKSSPTAGCWEITGHTRDDQVQYVVWLGPETN